MKARPSSCSRLPRTRPPAASEGRLPETPAQRWVRERLVALAKTGSPEALKKAFDVKDLALDKARTEALALAGRGAPAARAGALHRRGLPGPGRGHRCRRRPGPRCSSCPTCGVWCAATSPCRPTSSSSPPSPA